MGRSRDDSALRCSRRGQFLASFCTRQFRPEELQHNSYFVLVDESENVGAALAEPEMMHAVKPDRRAFGRIAYAGRDLIGAKAEELASREPMKRRRASGIRALGIESLAERRFLHGVTV